MNDSFDDRSIPRAFEPSGSSDGRSEPLTTPSDWPLFYHTARNMTLAQLTGIVERRLRHAVVPRLPVDFDSRYERLIPAELVARTGPVQRNLTRLRRSLSDAKRDHSRNLASEAAAGEFTFIGRTISFGDEIDWDHEKLDEFPLLWRLKLQSFEHLEWLVLGDERSSSDDSIRSTFEPQVLSWASENPIGERQYLRRSWIPHSVSLRILNWGRYAAWCEEDGSDSVSESVYEAIYKNALFLENHVEYEIDGNHLIENAIALIMAGVLFDHHDTGWTEKGVDILEQAAETQFLADGGHFERSPMYHIMVLRRYITAHDLLTETGRPSETIRETAERALGFLAEVSEPGVGIPLLNDAVRGEQLEAGSCLAYGASCSLDRETVQLDHPGGSGYQMIPSAGGTMLIDVGDVGPAHLPAHSHNDHLSLLLWIDGTQVLADTGVYDYGGNERRQYSRSVRSHNTVQYADAEPIPIGGSYLMGRRTAVEVLERGTSGVEATYSRDTTVGPRYEHRREVVATGSGWEVVDSVRSEEPGDYTVRYHFHPSVDVCEADGPDHGFVIRGDGSKLARFGFTGGSEHRLVLTPYFERFGQEQYRPSIEVESDTGTDVRTRVDVLRGETTGT
ncbi:hypothetical protein DJ74_17490 [Halorubrum sp. Ea8]|nr:hypothetical protein DJ74_17490 [Halorubrum sp. Ea8]